MKALRRDRKNTRRRRGKYHHHNTLFNIISIMWITTNSLYGNTTYQVVHNATSNQRFNHLFWETWNDTDAHIEKKDFPVFSRYSGYYWKMSASPWCCFTVTTHWSSGAIVNESLSWVVRCRADESASARTHRIDDPLRCQILTVISENNVGFSHTLAAEKLK